MNIVSRIRFPRTTETSELYMKYNEAAMLNFSPEKAEISFTKNGVLSFNSYFNSFYEKFYAKYTELDSLYYFLKLDGDFQVDLYREFQEQEDRKLIHTEIFENCQSSSQFVKIMLPNSWRGEDAGRVYLEITCLSDRGSFTDGAIVTDQPRIREVALGIITCTFKKEVYVKNTVDTIIKDECLRDKKLNVIIVDNGQTLKQEDFNDSRIQLILNRNLGGAGGFTRGLIQALQEELTYFLLMDDDIELESESIYRLFTLYEYASQDFAISGSMLDLYKKHTLYEAGALYAKSFNHDGSVLNDPFTNSPLKNKLNLNHSATTNLLLSEDIPDYGAFWFFAFSRETVNEIGLPMPFFIRADDIEFGLRITKYLGQRIVAFPSIAVWHEPFYAKNSIWMTYYQFRNTLVTHSIRKSLNYLKFLRFFTRLLLHKIFVFDYNTAEVMLKGFEDYMKGPMLIKSNDPETLHTAILALSKKYSFQNLPTNSSQELESNTSLLSQNKSQFTLKFKKILGLLTLNGHLLPSFMLSNESVLYSIGSKHEDWWTKIFPRNQVTIYREGNNHLSHYKMSRLTGIRLLLRWFQLAIISAIKWSYISAEWKSSSKYFTSMEFWKEYLKLNEQA